MNAAVKAWDEAMGEISGFGGSYEAACRAMVLAGIRWLDEHPLADPKFTELEGVFGLVNEKNDEATQFLSAVLDAPVVNGRGEESTAREEATGAMVHAAVQHCMYYRHHGWARYRDELCSRTPDGDEEDAAQAGA